MGLEFESPAGHQKEEDTIRYLPLFLGFDGDSNRLDATVRGTVARRVPPRRHINFCPKRAKMQTNLQRVVRHANESPAGHQKHPATHRFGVFFLFPKFYKLKIPYLSRISSKTASSIPAPITRSLCFKTPFESDALFSSSQ